MAFVIPLPLGLSLKMDDSASAENGYPTAILQKGLLLFDNEIELTEEAVGFGVPVLKKGFQTIFPGAVDIECKQREKFVDIFAIYKLNLTENISTEGNYHFKRGLLYSIKNVMAAAIRHLPLFRRLLTSASNSLRQLFKWKTTYGYSGFEIKLKVTYAVEIESGKIIIEMDTRDLPSGISEVVIMNELGASYFDNYNDSSGVSLHKEGIGCWDKVNASAASFESSVHHVAFRLGQVKGAQLFRGRELVGNRLNWAGFGYSFPPSIRIFRYVVEIDRIK